jgi:phage tail sheath gpL-like
MIRHGEDVNKEVVVADFNILPLPSSETLIERMENFTVAGAVAKTGITRFLIAGTEYTKRKLLHSDFIISYFGVNIL